MNKDEMLEKLKILELEHEELTTELINLDQLMRWVGFSEGIATVKATAKELSKHQEKKDIEE